MKIQSLKMYAAPYRCVRTPNVLYIGGPNSGWKNVHYSGRYYASYPHSPVVHFGRNEAWERGYYFQHRR